MRVVSSFARLWRRLFARKRLERELDDELSSYVDLLAAEKVRAGVTPAEARRAALLETGGVEQVKEQVRNAWTGAGIEMVLRDLRHGLRLLARSPGYTAAVVLSLGLGVGGATAVYSVVSAVLLRPLPYAAAGRLFQVRVWRDDFSAALSPADLEALREVGPPAVQAGAYFFPDDGFTVEGRDGAEVVQGAVLTTELPRVLGVQPLHGRWFSADPDEAEVLIGESLWRQRYGGAADVLGRAIDLDGDVAALDVMRGGLFTIVGVMPAGFNVPGQRDGQLWPRYEPRPPARREPFYLQAIVRVPPEFSATAAASRLGTRAAAVLRERYGVTEEWRYALRPLRDVVVGEVRATLHLLFGAVVLVLLIGVLNFSNLLLARGITRRHELGVRAALGAGRGRLASQLLVEAASVGLLAGVLGLALAALALEAAAGPAAAVIPRMDVVRLDATVMLFALAAGVGAGLLAGVYPALRLPWSTLALELREGGRGTAAARRHGRGRRVLVASVVSLTLTVLASAMLLVKSLERLEAVDPGFDAERVLSFRLALPETEYPGSANGKVAVLLAELETRLSALPGVSAVAFSGALPPDRLQYERAYTVEGDVPEQPGASDVAEWTEAGAGYFAALRIPLLRGRAFEAADREGAPQVAVVNEAFVRRHFPNGQAVGRRLKGGRRDAASPWLTIIGVVKDVPYDSGIWGGAAPMVYRALGQNLWQRAPFVVIRTAGDPLALLPRVREAVRALDPGLPLRDVATMQQRLHDSAAAPRLRGILFGGLAAIALALAVTGIFGVVAYDVNQRRRETAVRRALGAPSGRVVGMVLRSGMRLAGLGILVGLAGALLAGRALRGLLYGVNPLDPAALALSVAVIGAAALLACALPAWSAARTDPMAVLREE